jgi:hypothetical protein
MQNSVSMLQKEEYLFLLVANPISDKLMKLRSKTYQSAQLLLRKLHFEALSFCSQTQANSMKL